MCGLRRAPVELTDEERETYLRWWRANFSPAELERLARC